MEQVTKCTSCKNPLSAHLRHCARCGWDEKQSRRNCLRCEGPVLLHDIGFGPMAGMAGLGGFVFWWFFGLLLGLSIVCGISSLIGIGGIMMMDYRCSMCDTIAGKNLLSKDEISSLRKRRLLFLISGIGLAVAAVVLFFCWLAVVRMRHA